MSLTWGDVIDQGDEESFVGRERELNLFREELMRGSPSKLIFYISGQGGAGKTKLLKRYCDIAEALDFVVGQSDEEQGDVPSILGHFARQLGDKGHKLPRFMERYEKYRQLREEVEADPSAPQGLAGVFARTLVKVGFGFLEQVPVAGPLSKVMEPDIREVVGTQADEWATYLARKFKNKDEVLLVKEPLTVLPQLFFQDLNKVAGQHRVLLTFDNYEFTRRYLDEWLTKLTEYKPSANIRLVIAGRDAPGPKWDHLRKKVQRITLDVFSPEEAEQFLDEAGIVDDARRQEILDSSGRLPVLMEWLAAPEGDGDELVLPSADMVDRFLRWIKEPALRQAALYLTVPRFFNLDIVALLLEKTKPSEAEAEFEWLCRMPAINQRETGWQYHEVVQRYMRHYLRQKSEQTYRELHGRLAKYYDDRRNALQLDEKNCWKNETWRRDTAEYAYHHLMNSPETHWHEYLSLFILALRKQPVFAQELTEQLRRPVVYNELNKTQQQLIQLFSEQLQAIETDGLKSGLQLFEALQTYSLTRAAQITVHVYLGIVYALSEQLSKALASFTTATELDEKDVWALANRGDAHRQMGQYEAALADLSRAIELDDKYVWAIAVRGFAYRQMGQYEAALADLSRAIELNDKYAWAIAARGQTYRFMSQYEAAIADLNKAIELNSKLVWAIAVRGETYRAMGQYETALGDFDAAISLDITYAWAIARRGWTYELLEQYASALVDLDQAIELDPKMAWAFTQRGIVHRQLKHYEAALKDFEQAIKLDKNSVRSFAQYGETYRQIRQYNEALINFNQAIQLDGKLAWVICRRGETHLQMGQYEAALADFNRAIELDGQYAWAITLRGETYRQMKQYEAALADWSRAIELDGQYVGAIARRGETYRQMEQYEAALADFNRAIELDGQYAWAIAHRGMTYRQMGQHEAALADLNQAIELDEEGDWYFYNRGITHSILEDVERCTADFAQAILLAHTTYEKEPQNWQNIFNLAIYYLAVNRLEEAERLYQDGLQATVYAIQDAIRDLEDFLHLFPDHARAHSMRVLLQTELAWRTNSV